MGNWHRLINNRIENERSITINARRIFITEMRNGFDTHNFVYNLPYLHIQVLVS